MSSGRATTAPTVVGGATGFSALKQRALARTQPLAVHLELTYACNWRCVFCYNPRHHDVARMSHADWLPVLEDLRQLGTLTLTLTGGEALTHPEFFEIAESARALGFALKVFTNGSLIDAAAASRLARLRPLSIELSLHGATAATHDRTTGKPGSHQALWSAVGHLREHSAPVVLKTPLTLWNEAELGDIISMAAAHSIPLRVDPSITPRDDGDRTPLQYAVPADSVYRMMLRLKERGIEPDQTERQSGGVNCGLGRLTLAIDPEGNVYPCLQWRKSTLGNVRHTRLVELWQTSEVRQEAAGIARAANDMLIELGGPAARFAYCPALAFQRTGSELQPDPEFLMRAELAQRLRSEKTPSEVPHV